MRERKSQEAKDLLPKSLQHQREVNHDLERRLAETEARAQETAAALQVSDVTLDQAGRAFEHRTAALDGTNTRIDELTSRIEQLTTHRNQLQEANDGRTMQTLCNISSRTSSTLPTYINKWPMSYSGITSCRRTLL